MGAVGAGELDPGVAVDPGERALRDLEAILGGRGVVGGVARSRSDPGHEAVRSPRVHERVEVPQDDHVPRAGAAQDVDRPGPLAVDAGGEQALDARGELRVARDLAQARGRRAAPRVDHPARPRHAERALIDPPAELRQRAHGPIDPRLQPAEVQPAVELDDEEAVVAGLAPRPHGAVVHEVEDVDAAEQDGRGHRSSLLAPRPGSPTGDLGGRFARKKGAKNAKTQS